jgi:ABC-type transporter lipoprotein component MlaA
MGESDPYEKLRRAYKEKRGTNLTAEDVDKLMDDTAIRDAVMQTYADDDDAKGAN